jgi:HPt (histidine-containing phosphotransfer) domain-containing protein
MSGYIGKPFTSQELWRCLLRFFEPVGWQTENNTQSSNEDNELLQRLIRRFIADNSNKCAEIQDAIIAGDIVSAHRLAHTLKSNAGQLNKTSLQETAEAVEKNLKDAKNNVTTQQMQALKTELNHVLAELTSSVQELEAHGEPDEPLDTASALELLKEVEPLLKDFDTECLSYTDRLKAIPGSADLISQIENLDFGSAEESLTKLMICLEK